jgi:acyl-homoserine lactone acylase PvdQ
VVRYAVDLADLDHPWVGLAGGQSGHPGDEHYDDAIQDWLRGRARPLWLNRLIVAYHSRGIWLLHPPPPEPYP